MGKRWTWVAWAMLVAWAAGVAAFCVLSLANGNLQTEPLTDTVPLLLAFAAFMVVGALLVAHRPSNTIGWVFSAIGLLAVAGALAEEYAHYAYLTRPGSLPGAIVATWLAWCSWYPTVALAVVYTPLLFPTGRLLSPRWRPVAWLAGTATAAVVVVAALQPAFELPGGRTVPNPIGVEGVGNPDEGPIGTTLTNLLIVSTVAAFVSLVLRFRRSRGEERQQLKWFTYAAALVPFVALTDVLPDTVGNLLFAALVAMLPVAAGIAVLRYRLYEIDRLINRTLVYGLLTVLLGAVYVVGVFGFGRLLNPVTGESALAVAAATLAVAALFQPARRRVQAVVDRRFNRRRYDAARTVEAFSLRLRDQVELDTLPPSCSPSLTKLCSRRLCRSGSRHRHNRCDGRRPSALITCDTAVTPCMPCSFGFLPYPRSGAGAQSADLLEVTVTVRSIPLVTAPYGMWVARPLRTTLVPRGGVGSTWTLGEARPL